MLFQDNTTSINEPKLISNVFFVLLSFEEELNVTVIWK